MANPENLTKVQTVADLVQERQLPANIATFIMTECAKTLFEAAQKETIHQNIKPQHIEVSSNGKVHFNKI